MRLRRSADIFHHNFVGFVEINTIIPAKSRLAMVENLSQLTLTDLISPFLILEIVSVHWYLHIELSMK